MNFSFLVLALLFLKSKCESKNEKPTTGGLKWVTFNQWVEMPGGADENPSVRLSTYGDDICSIDHDGCWQGGKINHVYGNIIFINRYLRTYLVKKRFYQQITGILSIMSHNFLPHLCSLIQVISIREWNLIDMELN